MPKPSGRTLSLSPPRRVLCDLLQLARRVPAAPVERTMHLPQLAAALHERQGRPGWQAVFLKAFALVSADNPLWRRCYLPFPRPHLHEHPVSVACIPIVREYEGEETIFPLTLESPEVMSLARIGAILRQVRETPLDELPSFRRVLRFGRLPSFLRQVIWRAGLGWSGRFHAAAFGTFAISPFAGLGADSLHPLALFSPTLNHGPIARNGTVAVRLVYDHRVADGLCAAQALKELEAALNGPVVAELRGRSSQVLQSSESEAA